MDDYMTDQDRFFEQLLELAQIREASERERRLKALMERGGRTRKQVLKFREQIIRHCVEIQKMTKEQAVSAADTVLGLEPSN